MFRIFAFVYGTACYAMFLLVFLYAIGFVSGVGVPKHVDNGVATALPLALTINLVLLSLFAVQHSGMARPAFKRWWTRIVPAALVPAPLPAWVTPSSLGMSAIAGICTKAT